MGAERKTVVLGVTGSIAAYKAAEIVSRLKKLSIDVSVILTESGAEFITPLTLETLSGAPVSMKQFSRETPYEVEHIALAKKADVFLVAPATADFLGKAANGIADDLLTTTYLATQAPVLIAPAMNTNMYLHAAVQHNMAVLKERGCRFIDPDAGLLACGDIGVGRLADIDTIIESVLEALYPVPQDLLGKRILVSAGPTRESIDPVRYITNHSSGKMGYAIAEAAKKRGAEVTLVSGPVHLKTPKGVKRIDIASSAEMCRAVTEAFKTCDALIMAAAPADFTPAETAENKIKKNGNSGLTLNLVSTADILAGIGTDKGNRVVMGFAAETQDLEHNALGKLQRKHLDFIAANDVSAKNAGFGGDTNIVTLYDKHGGKQESGIKTKLEIANWLLDEIKKTFS